MCPSRVIGGGFHRAFHPHCIWRRRAIDVAVLEAKEIGWGASGRAFRAGRAIPEARRAGDPSALWNRTRHSRHRCGRRRPDLVFELIFRHRIEMLANANRA